MKAKLTKDEFDKLSDDFKNEYSTSGDEYALKVDGGEDTGALKRAKDHEKKKRQEVEVKLKTALEDIEKTQTEIDGIRKGVVSKDDVEALEKSYKERADKKDTEYKESLHKVASHLNRVLVDNVAVTMAAEISTVPDIMADQISKRLTIEEVDGKAVTKVIDTDGKPSALTVDDLKKEFVDNEKFAPIIVGSKASGSGARGAGQKGGAKKFSEMTEGEQVALYESNKEEYQRLRDSEKEKT